MTRYKTKRKLNDWYGPGEAIVRQLIIMYFLTGTRNPESIIRKLPPKAKQYINPLTPAVVSRICHPSQISLFQDMLGRMERLVEDLL